MTLTNSLNPQHEAVLTFKVDSTALALKWYETLKTEVLKKTAIKDPNRLYNFAQKKTELLNCVLKLKECAALINSHFSDLINVQIHENMSFADLNILHLFFEKLRGSIEKPSAYFLQADLALKAAIEKFNVEIHRYEDFLRSPSASSPRVVCTFLDRPRYDLQDVDFLEFSLQKKYGDVFINYCHVGKSFLEVYQAQDSVVTDENIRPQSKFSADFNVFLGSQAISESEARLEKAKVVAWIAENKKSLKLDTNKLAIGKIHVACLEKSNFFRDYENFDMIKEVLI